MELEYIYGSDSGKEGFEKCNRNFSSLDGTISTGFDTALAESKEWAVGTFSNPNMLINGDFQVWQRGTSIDAVAGSYTADRFKVFNKSGAPQISRLDGNKGGLKCENTGWCLIAQIFEDSLIEQLKGKTVTLSAQFRIATSGNNFKLGFNRTGNTQVADPIIHIGPGDTTIITNTVVWAEGYQGIAFGGDANANFEVDWIKLELGGVATPFVPRLYGEELAACQRYFLNMSDGIFAAHISATSSINIHAFIPTPVAMRVSPKILESNVRLIHTIEKQITGPTITSVSVSRFSANGISILAVVDSAVGTLGTAATINLAANFDAEI